MNHRNWCAPVTLTRDQPWADFPIDGLCACAFSFKRLDHGCFRVIAVQSVKAVHWAVHHPTKIAFSFLEFSLCISAFLHGQDASNWNPIRFCEIKITLVVTWDSHNRACTVTCDNEITSPNGNLFTRERMNGVRTQRDAAFLVHVLDPVEFAHCRDLIVEVLPFCLMFGTFGQRFSEWVFRGEGDKSGTEQSVWSSGEHSQGFITTFDLKGDFSTF